MIDFKIGYSCQWARVSVVLQNFSSWKLISSPNLSLQDLKLHINEKCIHVISGLKYLWVPEGVREFSTEFEAEINSGEVETNTFGFP